MDPIEQAALEAVATSARALTVALSCGGTAYDATVDEAVCVAQDALAHLAKTREQPRVVARDPVLLERNRIVRVLRKLAEDLHEPVPPQLIVTFAYLLEAAA